MAPISENQVVPAHRRTVDFYIFKIMLSKAGVPYPA